MKNSMACLMRIKNTVGFMITVITHENTEVWHIVFLI